MTTTQRQKDRETTVIRAPHDGSEVGVVALAGPEDVRATLDANVAAIRACRDLPAYARAAALRKIADGLEAARAEFARTLALEAGKPIVQAKTEIDRAIFVFRDGAEEATRIDGEVLPADVVPSANDAIDWANASPYGLQAGVFTTNLQTMFRLHAELDVGAVNGNDIPGFRVDRLPYGGAKASGVGREGVRYAIEEMTERRVLTLKLD